ncbi:unnamed protein product [Auanema sp. JU1783]|nr:unnamed protein product [Auanema sp. JU1783]
MSFLAAKYTGRGDVHVVDPSVDLRHIFDNIEPMKLSLEERRSKIDLTEVKEGYDNWWAKYNLWKNEKENAQDLKKELRAEQQGLLSALSLPNFVKKVGKEEKQMLKQSVHMDYLQSKGLMRIEKEADVVHLVGFPVLLQNYLEHHLLDMFSDATLISPSCFARAALLEAANVNFDLYMPFTDGSEKFPKSYLVGNSIFALLSPFVRSEFSEKNNWPITLQSIGMAYYAKKNKTNLSNARQRLKHTILFMARTDEEVESFIQDTSLKLAGLLDEGLLLELKLRTVKGKELKNYESQAITLEDKGLQLSRISRVDDYISRRLNIVSHSQEFVKMVYVDTDIDRVLARLIDGLVEGKPVARSIKGLISLD